MEKLNMWAVGMRKFYYGVLAEILLFIIVMWAPAITEAVRLAAINAMWLIGGLIGGAMMGENFAKKA